MTTVPEVKPDQQRLVKTTAYEAFQEREGVPIVT